MVMVDTYKKIIIDYFSHDFGALTNVVCSNEPLILLRLLFYTYQFRLNWEVEIVRYLYHTGLILDNRFYKNFGTYTSSYPSIPRYLSLVIKHCIFAEVRFQKCSVGILVLKLICFELWANTYTWYFVNISIIGANNIMDNGTNEAFVWLCHTVSYRYRATYRVKSYWYLQ